MEEALFFIPIGGGFTKTVDHLLLGRYLLAQSGTPALRKHRRAFLLGCVEPDYNPLSYLRGLRRHGAFRGHNAENADAFLARTTLSLEKSGVYTARDAFRLGSLLHYAADAFTAPHNAFWPGSLAAHRAYEWSLHAVFADFLRETHRDLPRGGWASLRRAYCAETYCPERDCRYILAACAALLDRVCAAEKPIFDRKQVLL